MPRQSRIDAAGALHHIIIRGIESSEFVEQVLREAGEQLERGSRLRRRGADLRWFIERVAVVFGVEAEDLKTGSRWRKVGKARAAVCCIAVREPSLSCAFLAKELQNS